MDGEKSVSGRSLLPGFFGNVLEWYDFTVYGFFAAVIGALFFPSDDPTVSLIASFGVFAAGYFMRPLGGLLFGHIGDKHGRKKALFLSILMMAIPTTLIGVLPTHAQIGWYAALLLTILRLAQGLSVGGEFTGSISFLVESAPPEKRGYYGSWTTFGVMGGMLLGSLIAAIVTNSVSEEQLYTFGWRIPFLFGAVIGITGLYLRRDMRDVETKGSEKAPIKEFWRSHKSTALKVIMLTWGFGVSVYLILIYMPTYLNSFHGVPLDTAMGTHTIALVVMMLLIPPMGAISDRIGKKTVMMIGMAGFVFLTLPLFKILFISTFMAVLSATLVFIIFQAMLQAALPALMAGLFPKEVRYTGLSVSYNISLALFGGTAPLVATWLIKHTGSVWMPAFYLIFATAISLVTMFFIRER